MPKVITVWEAPRFRGTCLCYAIFNGLQSAGKTVEFMDEPLHWRRFLPDPLPAEATRLDILAAEVGQKSAEIVVIKMQAKHLFDSQLPYPFARHRFIERSEHLILVRDTVSALVSHSNALGLMNDIPTELTLMGTGIPQLYEIYCGLRQSKAKYQVIDTDAIAKSPEQKMGALASTLDIPFSNAMINWDSVTIDTPPWGLHWYAELMTSQGWQSPRQINLHELSAPLRNLRDRVSPLMLKMRTNSPC